jgi:hypothetical protein
MIAFILLCIAIMLLGAIVGRPIGWVALGLALLALVLQLGVTAR